MEKIKEEQVNELFDFGKDAWDNAVEYAERRAFLGKHMPLCFACKSEQVQLVAYLDTAATWKCRVCKHRFEYEPNEGSHEHQL